MHYPFLAEIDPVAGWTLLATIVVAIATVAYVCLTHQLVRAQTDPCVIVYTKFDGGSHILLVIENVGNGIARDVRFELSREIPKYASGLDVDSAHVRETLNSGPLINGIPAMKPGETRVHVWGQWGGLKKALGSDPLTVKCHCRRLPSRFAATENELDPVECTLEVDSFEGLLYIADSVPSRLSALEARISKLESMM